MNILKAFKYRIYPTPEQQIQLAKMFGCKRVIFNHYLNEQQTRFKNDQKHLSNFDMNKDITKLKNQKQWLKEADSIALQAAAEDLSVAYDNFFNSIKGKRKGPKVLSPKFKTKYMKQSYRTRGVKIQQSSIIIPKIRCIKAVIHRTIPENSTIKSTTISKNTDGKYYASVLVEMEQQIQPMNGKQVGCDVGLKNLLTTSDGVKFVRPNDLPYIAKTKQLLKVRQRKFARTNKSGKNHDKARLSVARAYSKITRQRNDYYHCVSKFLVDNYDCVFVEDISPSNMLQNRKLSNAIHEVAWSTLTTMIAYKSSWAGKTYHRVDRWFPSSKTCSSCGYKLDKLELRTRKWQCPSCNEMHDRDFNAAKNILHTGQTDLYGQRVTSQTTGELAEIPVALQKFTSKIERSDIVSVGNGSKQARRSLVVG